MNKSPEAGSTSPMAEDNSPANAPPTPLEVALLALRAAAARSAPQRTHGDPPSPSSSTIFDRPAWLSFSATTALVLGVYLFTLTPEVGLENSGVFATGARYPAISMPPGFPVWSVYGWLFTVLLPFSNIAWRTAVASAVAGALACGILALIVAGVGSTIFDSLPGFERVKDVERRSIRMVCGCVAGWIFAFSGTMWPFCVVPNPWPVSCLLFTIVLALLTKWSRAPEERRWLYRACFVYGLTLTNSQTLGAAMLGLQIIVLLCDRDLGRDLFYVSGAFLTVCLAVQHFGFAWPVDEYIVRFRWIYAAIATNSFLVSGWLTACTGQFLANWKILLACGGRFLLGASVYFYLPLASMTNPPMNWGYPRTWDGFLHMLTRGQFEQIVPCSNPLRFVQQLFLFGWISVHALGWASLIAALLPFAFAHKLQPRERRWVLGMLALFLSFTFLLIVILNPYPGKDGLIYYLLVFFSPTHLLLAIFAGLGFILLAGRVAIGFKQPPQSSANGAPHTSLGQRPR